MTKANVLRALWYILGKAGPSLGTMAILECADQKEAEAHCMRFPFVLNDVVGLELMPLGPRIAYELLFAAPRAWALKSGIKVPYTTAVRCPVSVQPFR